MVQQSSNNHKDAAFLLMKTRVNAKELARELGAKPWIRWASEVYGPFPIIGYAEADNQLQLTENIEILRTDTRIGEIDARMCKWIPGDEDLQRLQVTRPETAVLLINVNYSEEKERIVTYKLRELMSVSLARAMWGPADIIAVVEEDSHETMRNLICDQIKTMKGVASNTTLYCYPKIQP